MFLARIVKTFRLDSRKIFGSPNRGNRKMLHPRIFAGSVLSFALTIVCWTAMAATIDVNAPDGSINAGDGLCSISEAIQNANDDATTNANCIAGDGADTIRLLNDVTLQATIDTTDGNTGTPSVSTTLTLDGQGFTLQRKSSLFCGYNSGLPVPTEFRLLHIAATGSLTLQNTQLLHGCFMGSTTSKDGGAIYNHGNLSIINSDISDNLSDANGGAIFSIGGNLSVDASTFYHNYADVNGGAIHAEGGVTISAIQNSIFMYNIASFGGVLYLDTNSNLETLENTSISTNRADDGIFELGGYSTIGTIKDSTYAGNFGSAILIHDGSIGNIQNNTFSNNGSGYFYGGEAISMQGGNFDEITNISNNTFAGNYSQSQGVSVSNSGGVITSMNNNLFGPSLTGPDDSDCYTGSSATTNGSNNLSDGSCTGTVAAPTGFDNNLTDNGCETPLPDRYCVKTHALYDWSNALNASTGSPPSTDQRGFGKIATRDIGAYEYIGDQDSDGIPDRYEEDNDNLDPLDPDDAQLDPDNDLLVNLDEFNEETLPNDPDTDGDEIADGLDRNPTVADNECGGMHALFQNQMVTIEMSCGASKSVTVETSEVQYGGDLELISPTIEFRPGFKVWKYGSLSVKSETPCAACP